MSETITEDKIQIIQSTHKFYCDGCGTHLLDSVEYSDGYYEEPKKFYIQHVRLKGHYCEKCGNERVSDVIKYARNKGFAI